MAKIEKLSLKAKTNPDSLSFQEFTKLLCKHGWLKDRQNGSHEIWIAKHGAILPIQNWKGKAKGYQVKQFLRLNETIE